MTTKSTSSGERLEFCTSTHWVKYLPNGIKNHFLGLLGLILLLVSSFSILETVSIITFFIGAVLLLYAHHHFFHKLLSESMYDIFLTNERIIYFDDSLFFTNDEHEIPLERIAGIDVNQKGLVQNLLGYGTLWVDTGGNTTDYKRSIPFVPNPEQINEKIATLLRKKS